MNEEKYKLGSIEETQRLAAEGNRLYGTNAFNTQTGAPITSQGLVSEPPIELPEPTPSTISGRIDGQATSLLEFDALEQKAAQETADREAKLQESQAKSSSLLERIGITKKDVTSKVEEEFGLSALKETRKIALQKLRTAQVSELGEIERLQTANMTDAGRASAEEEIRRKYGFEKLESQLSYYMATDNITAVETTLNDRLTLELEPLYQQLEMQKGVSEQIYDQLTISEKRVWDLAISKTENSIQERKDIATYRNGIITTAMQNGVPLNSYQLAELNRADSIEAVNQVLANERISLADPMEKRIQEAQLANLYSQIEERNRAPEGVITLTGEPQTAAQSSANGYADRVAEANVVIDTLGSKFTGKFAIGGSLPNTLQSGDRQAYEQANRNFVNAVLRRESGAAISPTEFTSAEKQYFPQAGDQPQVVRQKEVSRNTAINNLYRESNVTRPVLPGQIIESDGKRYRVGSDGETLTEI